MNEGWIKSDLQMGEELIAPRSIFVSEQAKDRLVSVNYIGETKAGIMLECKFKPSFGTKEPDKAHYRRFIDWAGIWAGHVKIYRADESTIRARRVKKSIVVGPTVEGVNDYASA